MCPAVQNDNAICPQMTMSHTSRVPSCRCLLSLDVQLRSPHLPLRNSETAGVQVRNSESSSVFRSQSVPRCCCRLMLSAAALYFTNTLFLVSSFLLTLLAVTGSLSLSLSFSRAGGPLQSVLSPSVPCSLPLNQHHLFGVWLLPLTGLL